MRIEEFSAVVFDVDGTLFDTERISGQTWGELGRKYGWLTAQEDHNRVAGRNEESIWNWIRERMGADFPVGEFMRTSAELLQTRIEREGVPLKPGARELLDLLKGRGVPMALATSTDRRHTLRRLELAGLEGCFRTIITGDQVSRSKPDPEIYLLACQGLEVPPGRALAVEDSANGVRSAAAAGLRVALVPDIAPLTPEDAALAFRKYSSLLELRDDLK